MDNFEKLESSKHMLESFSENPYVEICGELENALRKQVPDCAVKTFTVTSEPLWLTGVRPDEEDLSQSILVKTGVSFDIELLISEPNVSNLT